MNAEERKAVVDAFFDVFENAGINDFMEIVDMDDQGNVTCLFEHFCPVAFCVKNEKNTDPTGDISGNSLLLWFLLLASSSAAVLVLSANRRKFTR